MKKLKKSLRGYSPAAVHQIIAELQDNHRIRMEELKEQARLLSEEHERLSEELERLTESGKNQPAALPDQLAAKRLLEAHLKQTDAVWQSLQQLKADEEEMNAESEGMQSERDQMLEHVERKLKETLFSLTEGRAMT